VIKKLLHQISVGYMQGEDRVNAVKHYFDLMQHHGWQTHEQFLMEILNGIQNYMFSEAYTNLDIKEKDVQQRVFFATKEILQFLVNPMRGANINAAIKQHNKKIGKQKRPVGEK
jgi:hypothetical protein